MFIFDTVHFCYAILVITQLVLRGFATYYMLEIYKNTETNISMFIILESIYYFIDLFITPFLVIKIAYQAQRQFEAQEFDRYNRLTFETKKRMNVVMFWNILNKAGIAIYDILAWIPNAIVDIIGSLITILYTFVKEDLLPLFLLTLLCWITFYMGIIRPWQMRVTTTSSRSRDIMNESYTKLILNLYPFQYKERTPAYMMSLRVREIANSELIDKDWQKIITVVTATIKVAMFTIIVLSPENFMLLMYVLSQLESVLVYAARVQLRFMKMIMDIRKYNESLNGLKSELQDVKNLSLPKTITILSCNIQRDNFAVTLNTPLQIHTGDRILIEGASGHGKTTFIDGFCGKIDGMELSENHCANYYHLVADMYQNIREKMPSSTTTVRDYFKDEEDDILIIKCLSMVFMPKELAFIQQMLPTKNMSWLDSEIDERFSGGQKSRLCIATRLYELEKNGKKILIMDEAEQGSDYENVQYMMGNIFNMYIDTIIIMITHMHIAQLEDLKQVGVRFNKHISITDGHVLVKHSEEMQ